MKMKFNTKALAAAVCAGSMSFGAVGTAQADSLFAPLVISNIFQGFETLFSLKVRGNGTPDAGFANSDITALHYTYLRKGNTLGSLFYQSAKPTAAIPEPANLKACLHENGNGKVTSWDMINHATDAFLNPLAQPIGTDQSTAFHPATPFYGMAVIDDAVNVNKNEGDFSGFAYVMNYFTGTMIDYKLLNNHRSTTSGDFSVGFTRKTSVDLAWNPLNRDVTLWLGVATNDNTTTMTTGNAWAGSIKISQDTNVALGNVSPKIPHAGPSNPAGTGVYNNDEVNFSGDRAVNITCMSLFDRFDFLNATQEVNTRFGGWTRKSIIGSDGAGGGMIYKAELKLIPSIISGRAIISFQPETSGHLSDRGPRANRPY